MIPVLGPAPLAPLHAVVEDRLAVEAQLYLAVHAAHVAQQDVVGLVICGRAAMGDRVVVLVVPWADEQQVAHDDPASGGRPARFENHGAGQVPTGSGDRDVGRSETKASRIAIQDRGEHDGRVHAREA